MVKFSILTELGATGKADSHFIGKPEHSIFRKEFRQHANFAVDFQNLDVFQGGGNTLTATITKCGDYCIGAAILFDQTGADVKFSRGELHNSYLPYALKIGGQEIQTGFIKMDLFYDRLNGFGSKQIPSIIYGDAITVNEEQERVAFAHLSAINPDSRADKMLLFIDPFFSMRGQAMSLHTEQTIEIEIQLFDELQKHLQLVQLQTFQVYLEEKDRYQALLPRKIPILQQQIRALRMESKKATFDINFNLPMAGLEFEDNLDDDTTYTLQFVNNVRASMTKDVLRSITYYISGESGVAIPFGIPDDGGFGGAINFSKITNVTLIIHDKKSDITEANPQFVTLSGYNYNILQYTGDKNNNGKGAYRLLYSD